MSWLAIWTFVKGPVGRYVLLAVAAISLCVGFAVHFKNEGKRQGREEAKAELTETHNKELAQVRTETKQQLDAKDADIARAQHQFDNAQLLIDKATSLLSNIQAQRKAGQDNVNRLPDSQLHDYNITKLHLRDPKDLTAGYYPQEERSIASCLTDQLLCQQTTEQQGTKIEQLSNQIKDQGDQIKAISDKFDKLASYTRQVESAYVDAYNAVPRKGNSLLRIVTFGVKGKPKKISLPDPITLTKGKP